MSEYARIFGKHQTMRKVAGKKCAIPHQPHLNVASDANTDYRGEGSQILLTSLMDGPLYNYL